MNEGLRNLAVLVWALCAVNTSAYANDANMVIAEEATVGEPTIVYGAARKAEGVMDEVVLEQPANAPNPLGNPIVLNSNPASVATNPAVVVPVANLPQPAVVSGGPQGVPVVGPNNGPVVNGSGPQGVPVVPNSAAQLGNQFQNTVEEANGMIYDTQAYPIEDLGAMGNPSNPETIYSPNVNPN